MLLTVVTLVLSATMVNSKSFLLSLSDLVMIMVGIAMEVARIGKNGVMGSVYLK